VAAAFSHLVADFIGVPAEQLRDGALIGGLLIAAAGAAGFGTIGMPTVRAGAHGLAATLLLDDCHMVAHTFPDRGLMLLDVLAVHEQDARRALDVFARRLTAREVRSSSRGRG
jgi:S-adenosylmethionine decarboxylase